MNSIKYETELFEPIKNYLEKKGFKVYAEVKKCDIIASCCDIILIVELKKEFNLKLLYQVMDRQKYGDFVYAAIPRPKNLNSKSSKNMIEILKKLNIGLIFVDIKDNFNTIKVVLEPVNNKIKNNKNKKSILKEIEGRKNECNIGGTKGKKIITSYRENAIYIACVLEFTGENKVNKIKEFGCGEKTGKILYYNYYGWFERVKTGFYKLTDKALLDLNSDSYIEITKYYRNEVKNKNDEIVKK